MKAILIVLFGIVLIVSGTAILTYQGVTVTTAHQQLLQVGPLQAATRPANWTITLPPILGAAFLAGGAALVFVAAIVRRMPPRRSESMESHVEPHLVAPKTR